MWRISRKKKPFTSYSSCWTNRQCQAQGSSAPDSGALVGSGGDDGRRETVPGLCSAQWAIQEKCHTGRETRGVPYLSQSPALLRRALRRPGDLVIRTRLRVEGKRKRRKRFEKEEQVLPDQGTGWVAQSQGTPGG